MIITKLTFHNFGVYAGNNVFEFESSKPVALIGGMNGRGKTTFLEGVLLALYGANSFAYSESKYSSYGQYLKAFVNTADGSLETYVELEFKLENETDERYLIRRSWFGNVQRTRETIQVKKDGQDNTFLTDNWAMFIENILPSGLSSFFFFDGEKIAELAVENTNAQMKESIKTLLGISVLDLLDNDISRIVNRVGKRSNDKVYTKELEILRERKNQTEVALQIIDDHIAETSAQIEEARKKLEKAKVDYTSKGGVIVVQRQDLFTERTALVAKVEQGKETLIGVAASELPLLLVKDLLEDISVQAAKEHETKLLGYTVDKIHSMFATYSNGGDSNSVRDFISYVENKAAEESTEIVFDISDQSFYQLTSLLRNGLMNAQGNMLQNMATCQKGIAKIDEIDSYLSVDIDEKALSKIYKKIKTLEQEIIEHEAALEIAQKQRTGLNGDVMRATSEYNRFVENMLSNLESDDDNGRILKYAHHATQVLAEYKIRLQKKKIGTLAETMTKCYKQLANKKNLISRIDMDAVTLDFVYLNADNQIVSKESLSAGEKQLMVISLLWALAICSKKKLPVIIDTPLSRMDSVHRVALIKTYFPNASDQTIILSTDSEIDKHYYEIMKDTVGDEFTLVYDDELKCSKIKKGYFLGD
ncbi:DNA sulfur modification protein DndD [Phascolarctobacterium succinatutens]|uniref:DNA sulfur modification protein DndD n=1 Tax=Phascolarctobacterium succinatutens TaxID=626940 RepID=UPI0026F1C35C|nr:DNA sulfur modification protein DndD [Phascolarctobacterium succinatutens]